MLYTIKQYKILFMNSIINKMGADFEGWSDIIDTWIDNQEKALLSDISPKTVNAISDNIPDYNVPVVENSDWITENNDTSKVTEEELRDLLLDEDIITNLAYKVNNGDSIVVINDTLGNVNIQINGEDVILNWQKTDYYNTYFSNSSTF